jgi:hypothetical protein
MNTAMPGSEGHITEAEAAAVVYAPGQDHVLEERVRSHLTVCPQCASRLEELRSADRSTGALLSSLDVRAPSKSASDFIRDIQMPKQRSHLASPRRVAAAIAAFMVMATVAAAAIPASPLHRLIVRAISGDRAPSAGTLPVTTPAAATSSAVSLSQLSSLDVGFDRRGAGSAVHLSIVEGDQVSLSSEDLDVAYKVGSNRIAVAQSAPADFQLAVPRGLRDLRILIDDRVVFERRAGTSMTADTLTIRLPAQH